jgi:Ca-activated chloride channel family protein
MTRLLTCAGLLLLVLLPASAWGQGILVVTDPDEAVRLPRPIIIWPPRPPVERPMPPTSYKIESLQMRARLIDQVAQVQVSQSFVNTGSRPLEVCFVFPLPYDGAIDQMTLMVDGKEFPAKLLGADEARKAYEEIVRKNRDPALLEWVGTGMFRTSVFPVPPGQKRTVSLRYSQLCRKQEGLTDFLFPLSTAKYTSHPVESIDLRLSIESKEEIKNLYSPSHKVDIERADDHHATVTCKLKDEVPAADFRLFYDVGKGKLSARVLSYRPKGEEGYFLLLASPKIKAADEKPPKKTVVFVADRSGSMSGKKIEQVRGALTFVLNNLREGDLFNIIAYDSEVESFRPELQRFDDESRKAALGFIEGLYAGGGTDINAALKTALGQLQDSKRPNYVIFLTDGLPTVGETNEMKIVDAAREANRVHARLFAFGVGYDVNSRLLDRLVRENFGLSQYVRPEEDVEDSVSRLYRRIESPVMTGVTVEFVIDENESRSPVNRVYPKGNFDLFAGEQLVVVGRYGKSGEAKVIVRGSVNGKTQKFDFPAELVQSSDDETYGFVERLWAIRRVGEILDELDLKGKNDELIQELVELSTRHGILTPYTSFFADENTRLHDTAANTRRATDRLRAMSESSGYGGFAQRAYKGSLQRSDQASPSSAPAFAPGAMGGMGGGGPAAGRTANAAPAQSFGLATEAAVDYETSQQTVRNIGNRAFYQRSGQWIDSTLKEKQLEKPTRVKQFSDEYFALVRRHGRALSQYLVFDEPVLVNLNGQAYLVEP